jgi:hypothetical protein
MPDPYQLATQRLAALDDDWHRHIAAAAGHPAR